MPLNHPHLLAVLLFSIAAASVSAAERAGTVLITGANRGIGLAMAKNFSEAGYAVIGTARKPKAASDLHALSVRVVKLDVTDPASVASLAKEIGEQPIDILINNAGILRDEAPEFADVDIERLEAEYQVNALGPLRVTQALLPNINAGKRKVVVNISSMMGSMELNTFGCCMGYRASKSALNSFTKTLAVDMGNSGTTFVALHPGYVKTDLNDGAGAITVEKSAEGLFTVIRELDANDNGKFYQYDGASMPW